MSFIVSSAGDCEIIGPALEARDMISELLGKLEISAGTYVVLA